MNDDIMITPLHQPGSILDPLTEIAREGARQMLAAALRAEAASFVARFADERLSDGRQRVVHHGIGPERTIQTGIGPLAVKRHKVRDRTATVWAGTRIRFTSNILPQWARRSRSLDALLPVLYLRGISTGDFQEALTALLGADAPNLSPGVISRLTAGWQEDYDRWQRRDLSARRYVYIWAVGVYLQARIEPQAECMLVVLGATPEGRKALVGFQVGVRESAQSWRELFGRPQDPRPRRAAGTGGGRWRPGLLEGTGGDLPQYPSPALLVSQDVECAQPFPQIHAACRHRRSARDLPCRDPRCSVGGHRDLQGKIRRQIPARHDLPNQGLCRTNRLMAEVSRRHLIPPHAARYAQPVRSSGGRSRYMKTQPRAHARRVTIMIPEKISAAPARWNACTRSPRITTARTALNRGISYLNIPVRPGPMDAMARFQQI